VENATLPAQRVLLGKLRDLPRIAQEIGPGPAVIILGEVLRQALETQDSMTVWRRPSRTAASAC